ncbi:unnamed protein product [Phytophthora lilii]|uniref:Unnamed protein product n=1 Tax=Phytophthora lilii TaxID=2077276 RepID=A0A9W6YDR1_9STRA|nr:unnamed protein product [Phytophthora lilii]
MATNHLHDEIQNGRDNSDEMVASRLDDEMSTPDGIYKTADPGSVQEAENREIFRESSEMPIQTISDRGGYSEAYNTHPAANDTIIPGESPYSFSTANAAAGTEVFVRGSTLDRNIEAVIEPASGDFDTKSKHYKGRYRVRIKAITFAGLHKNTTSIAREKAYAKRKANASTIKGGASGSGSDLVSDDGVVGNPKSYADMSCELPDYQSKNGRIYSVASNGTEVAFDIKGVNWFGMETGPAIPLGLWDNANNGTNAYQIANFLEKNKFNAVRLPLCVSWILKNKTPQKSLINTAENRAISAKDYMSLLKSIVKSLAYRKIGVLLSMHTLTSTDNGGLWYSNNITQADFLTAIDTLTKNLCSKTYWNIIGIDLKNEPFKATWGDGSSKDWHAGAKTIGDRMLKGCSNWLGFVKGIYESHSLTMDGKEFNFYDWYGGGLTKANLYPLSFSTKNKVVYAPHYYTPAVYPQGYFYGGGTPSTNGVLNDYIELSNSSLKSRIQTTMNEMFGFIADNKSAALLLGEFGGLYATDAHPNRTTTRCTDLTIDIVVEKEWSGGFVWSLNPESSYQYNPADTRGSFTEGILESDWLTANSEFFRGMTGLNDLKNLRMMPCFEVKGSSSGSSH